MYTKNFNTKLICLIIIILAVAPFLIGRYLEFNDPSPYDLSLYIYSAKNILDGAKIGVEEKSTTYIGRLSAAMLGVWLGGYGYVGPLVVQSFLQVCTFVFMFIAMYRLFGKLSASVVLVLASFYLSAPFIAYDSFKEQCMIGFMVMGVSCFVLYQLGGRRWYAVLAGAFLSLAPLFKETGISAISAMFIFIALQPLLKNRSWKQTGIDALLLLAGGVSAIGPLYAWIITGNIQMDLPYSFAWKILARLLSVGTDAGMANMSVPYISVSRAEVPFSKQWPKVLRYYSVLRLPIALAVGAIAARIVRMIQRASAPERIKIKTYDRFVLLFAVWWILDMTFVWISPRSYSHYYLPLCASAAILGGYVIALYSDKLKSAAFETRWLMVGLLGLVSMIIMSWHIVFGAKTTPSTGRVYKERKKGYVQRFVKTYNRRKQNFRKAWRLAGEYIHAHSEPTDKIYVWGWLPGIYITAQRLSPVPVACMAGTHMYSPEKLSEVIDEILSSFNKYPPKFIVDTRKGHFPYDRPPLQLWPRVRKGFMGVEKRHFLPLDNDIIAEYDAAWSQRLRQRFGEDEALRYEVMRPFREYVMRNYEIVKMFDGHVLFELKSSSPIQEQE